MILCRNCWTHELRFRADRNKELGKFAQSELPVWETAKVYEVEPDEEQEYTNFYCHCGTQWSDKWTAMCNDECPECSKEIEPYASEDEEEEITLHVDAEWKPQGGLPKGIDSVTDLNGWPA